MSDVSATIDSLRALAGAGRPVALDPATLARIAGDLEDASATAAGQDAAVAACTQALRHRVQAGRMLDEAEARLARAATLRRHQWALLAAQVVVLAIWGVMIWGWG